MRVLSSPCGVWRGESCARTRIARAPRHARTGRPHVPHTPRAAPPWRAIAQGRLACVADRAGARAPRACATGSGARTLSTRCVCSACVHAHHRSAATAARIPMKRSPQAGALRQPIVCGFTCHSSLCHSGVRVRACVRVCARLPAPLHGAWRHRHATPHATPHATHRMLHTAHATWTWRATPQAGSLG